MCKVSNYPGLYSNAKETLRREGLNPEMPGYEFLRRAIVIYKVEGEQPKEEFLSQIKEGMLIPSNKDSSSENKKTRDEVEQWMIESIKSVGIDIPLMEYIKQLADEINT